MLLAHHHLLDPVDPVSLDRARAGVVSRVETGRFSSLLDHRLRELLTFSVERAH